MKKLLWLLFFYPYLVFGQINALYSLLNWNTPEQQKGLIAWYDLQDPSAVQLGANQQIFMLKDKSIWNNHISQLTSSYQPLFISDSKLNTSATVNGISFANGGYMTFRFPSTKTVQGITSFVICKNSLGGSKLLYDLSLEGGEGVASCYAGLDKVESRVPNSLVAFEPNFSTNPNQYLFIATRGSAGNVQASLNDSQYVGQGTRNFVGDRYNRIRLSTEQGVAPSDGTLYELVLFDRKLTDDEFNSVKKYLAEKYYYSVNNQSKSGLAQQSIIKSYPSSSNVDNQSNSRSSLIEGNSQNTQQKSLSDQIADKIIQEGYNDFLKGLNNPNPTKNTSNGVRHRCTWCNKGFSSTGWILEKTRVIRSGSPYAEPVISSNERCKAHYDTQECALRARKARDGY